MNWADRLFLRLAFVRPNKEHERKVLQEARDEAEIAAMTWMLKLQHRTRDLERHEAKP